VLEVKRIEVVAGRPLGLEFPYESFVVRVAVKVEPEARVEADAVTELCKTE